MSENRDALAAALLEIQSEIRSLSEEFSKMTKWRRNTIAANLAARHVLAVDALSDEAVIDIIWGLEVTLAIPSKAERVETARAVLRRFCEGGER